jgi:hypothetical protein
MKLLETSKYKILWGMTPESDPTMKETEIASREEFEKYKEMLEGRKGTGYFYIDVWNMQARLAFYHMDGEGQGRSETIEDFQLTEKDIDHVWINRSGWYPVIGKTLQKIQNRLEKNIFVEAGRKGGKAGTGEAKRRGDSEYYRRLAKKRKKT